MGFDKISYYEEVLQYYGTLDQVYELMKSYSLKSGKDFESSSNRICKQLSIQRKTMTQAIDITKDFSDNSERIKLAMKVYNCKTVHLDSAEKYTKMTKFVHSLPEDHTVKFENIYFGSGYHKNVLTQVGCNEKHPSAFRFTDDMTELWKALEEKHLTQNVECLCDIKNHSKLLPNINNTFIINTSKLSTPTGIILRDFINPSEHSANVIILLRKKLTLDNMYFDLKPLVKGKKVTIVGSLFNIQQIIS